MQVGILLHAVQVERQRAVLLAVDTEAEEESTINRELANVMCARLDAARRATERLLGVLQVCHSLHSRGSNIVCLTHRSLSLRLCDETISVHSVILLLHIC